MRTPTSRVVLHEIQTNHIKKKYGIKFSVSTIRQTLQLFQKIQMTKCSAYMNNINPSHFNG